MVSREAIEDCEIPVKGTGKNAETIKVKAGTKVNLCIHAVHMNQDVFNLSLAERSKLFVSQTYSSLKHSGASKEGIKVTSRAPQESMMESIIRSTGAEAL